jgi:DNA-binding NarL/FixJ family response regulator
MKKICVLVTNAENIVREGISAILSLQPDMDVVGQAGDGIRAVELAEKLQPDVILLDLAMPRRDGLATIPILIKQVPHSRILMLSSFADPDLASAAIKAGALGYLLIDATRDQLLQAIRDVARRQTYIQPPVA